LPNSQPSDQFELNAILYNGSTERKRKIIALSTLNWSLAELQGIVIQRFALSSDPSKIQIRIYDKKKDLMSDIDSTDDLGYLPLSSDLVIHVIQLEE